MAILNTEARDGAALSNRDQVWMRLALAQA
jgi:hypothetical protein